MESLMMANILIVQACVQCRRLLDDIIMTVLHHMTGPTCSLDHCRCSGMFLLLRENCFC
jgi:hypothetical protein